MKKFLILLLLLLPFVYANGLSVTPNTIVVNKTLNTNLQYEIQISNTDSFDFLNVTLEDNNYATIQRIPILLSGESKNVTLIINSNENFIGDLRIKGVYNTTQGLQNRTYDVNLDWNRGSDKCDFEIVRGDKIKWNNIETSNFKKVEIINTQNNNVIQSLFPNESYVQLFETPQAFQFHITDGVFPLPITNPKYCTLTVQNDFGYVNSPQYDAILNLNVNVNHPPTSISSQFLTTNYSIQVSKSQSDIFKITTIGNNTAKVSISGEWMSFTQNNFDLLPNQNINVGYTILPLINSSNQTNQTYIKELIISGNFDTIRQNISVFVPYSEFVLPTNSTITFEEFICQNYPQFCEDRVIYVPLNDSNLEFNYTMQNRQIQNLWSEYRTLLQSNEDSKKLGNENDKKMLENISTNTESLNILSNDVGEIRDNFNKMNDTISFIVFSVIAILCAAILLYIASIYIKRNAINKIDKF